MCRWSVDVLAGVGVDLPLVGWQRAPLLTPLPLLPGQDQNLIRILTVIINELLLGFPAGVSSPPPLLKVSVSQDFYPHMCSLN